MSDNQTLRFCDWAPWRALRRTRVAYDDFRERDHQIHRRGRCSPPAPVDASGSRTLDCDGIAAGLLAGNLRFDRTLVSYWWKESSNLQGHQLLLVTERATQRTLLISNTSVTPLDVPAQSSSDTLAQAAIRTVSGDVHVEDLEIVQLRD